MIQPQDFLALTERLASDTKQFLFQSRDTRQVMLFKALQDQASDPLDLVGTLEQRETTVNYAAPIIVKARFFPNDNPQNLLASGFQSAPDFESPKTVLLDSEPVPEQSILWCEDRLPNDKKTVELFYVLAATPIGKHGLVGAKHQVLPMSHADTQALLALIDEVTHD
ncbi:hypothetical protein H0A36_26595 [Endozoicomonas sp. SM1973]|uniref:Uncharacterized protein n=1 Tax=Spartinivicinus marinus TaxID=2994442 RepID=A0A853IGB9_9GAMM|nr:hypothetical protein [Spartinivicinus marinus]MCX4030350.1 hypothetical protein [Spartinivicinus marinus]MCX4030481.1 hypothetical protein [Spartinivicinus marinus]NYZ69588.1 hypothetical protein [Spartinivicinus marinus]